jgi:hypothetical protein
LISSLTEAIYRDQESGSSISRDAIHGLYTSLVPRASTRTEKPKETQSMSITSNNRTSNDGHSRPVGIEDLDLTPAGLADAPANELDRESIVHTGNS